MENRRTAVLNNALRKSLFSFLFLHRCCSDISSSPLSRFSPNFCFVKCCYLLDEEEKAEEDEAERKILHRKRKCVCSVAFIKNNNNNSGGVISHTKKIESYDPIHFFSRSLSGKSSCSQKSTPQA